jgi:hypothetical protein
MTRFDQGDPKMILTDGGVDMNFVNGLPELDPGLENVALIALGTDVGFAGNKVAQSKPKRTGSTFIEESKRSITANQILVIEDAAEKAFTDDIEAGLLKSVSAEYLFISDIGYSLSITLTPPTGENRILQYNKNGENWIEQRRREQ